jgi:glycosidase
VVTTFDDHDQVRKGRRKSRFAHDEVPGQRNSERVVAVLAFLATTMGIPCVYYGTEQGFDGHGDNDRFIREAMFGGEFGAFESRGRHFFDENNPIYVELRKILALRRSHLVIRRGRQFLRQLSGDGHNFGPPVTIGGVIQSVVAWSRIFSDREILLAVNTDVANSRTAWVTIDAGLHETGSHLTFLYSTAAGQIGNNVTVEARNGKAVQITVPPAGFVALA